MITSDINKCLRGVTSYCGAHPCNSIPDPVSLPAAFVVNTAPLTAADKRSNEPVISGKHWVVLVLHNSSKAEYFDSFGVPPNQSDIVNYISTHSTTLKFNSRLLQDPLSSACGVWCIDYIIQRMKLNVPMRKYLSSFPGDPTLSDRLVVDRVACGLSARQRQLVLSVRNCLN